MIRNQIRLATVKEYTGNYAMVVLRQGEGFFDEADRTIEEVMLTRLNSGSQGNPDIGVDVLIAFDDTGDAYLIAVVGSDNQPLPASDEPGALVYKNVPTLSIDEIELKVTEDGKIGAGKTDPVLGPVDLITILIDALNYIATSTCPPGSPLTNAAMITAEALKLVNYKVV